MDKSDRTLQSLLADLDESDSVGPRSEPSSFVSVCSVRIDPEVCVGCAACMRACPMEAIRIGRDGKALIKSSLCIDCGECIRVCAHKAAMVLADPLRAIHVFKYRIAVPEASLYGQFAPSVLPNDILGGVLELGFDEVYEVSLATDLASLMLKEYVNRYEGPRPLFTSLCPVVVRLIQIRFPELIDRVIPVDSTLELGIRELKDRRGRELGILPEQIGAFYLSGCPSRITNIRRPYAGRRTFLDGAISIGEIYKDLLFAIKARQRTSTQRSDLQRSSGLGILWGTLGGEIEALGRKNTFAVSDMKHLLRVLEEIEDQKLRNIEFVECRGCYGGCTGGPLMVDNPYQGRAKIQMLSRMFAPKSLSDGGWVGQNFERYKPLLDRRFAPRPAEGLDPDPSKAIRKLARRANILKNLPGIDCGVCGAPSCKALADDIVRGEASAVYCLFKLRDSYSRQKGGPGTRKSKRGGSKQ